jgi:drug/metabolite transporter (DMT)-like permease/protein-S-isoprenylcysteine O-methyltransferase Ste14
VNCDALRFLLPSPFCLLPQAEGAVVTVRQFGLLILLGLIWGASFMFIKVALPTVPPFTIVFVRTALAGIVLYSVVRLRGRRMPPWGPIWGSFLIMGLLNGAIPYSLINWGEIHIEAGLGAIFNSLMPLFTVLFAHFATRDERFSGKKLVGVFLGLGGVMVLMGQSAIQGLGSHVLGQLAVTGAAASYAVAAIYGKRLGKDTPFVLAAGQMFGGALLIAPLMIVIDRPWTLSPDLPAVFCLILLAVTNTALAYVLYYYLLGGLGATRLSLVTYIIPVSGVFWGWLVLDERLGWSAFAALGLILASVATVSEMSVVKTLKELPFDPFGWATRSIPERTLHGIVRGFMILVCVLFLVRRVSKLDAYLVKPLWAVETLVYVVLILAFLVRTVPVDRSRGLAEIALPGVGALLPFALLFSAPAGFVVQSVTLHRGVFWIMTLATVLTVWGMWNLRRSFSITVEARELVTTGVYRFVRHPVYLGEIMAALAVTVWRMSLVSIAVFSLFVAIQLVRARMEETKLDLNFGEYEAYKSRVWWFWR